MDFHFLPMNSTTDIFVMLYAGKYSPRFIFVLIRPRCQKANLRLGEFHSLNSLSLIKHNIVWASSRWGETVCNQRRAKITQGKITLYTVQHLSTSLPVDDPRSSTAKHHHQLVAWHHFLDHSNFSNNLQW